MNEPFSYSTTYELDKNHFSETYDETCIIDKSLKGYTKTFILGFVGTAILMTEINAYIAWFIITLAAVEALNVRFHKPWWMARQMISRAANHKVTLTIDEAGVHSQSHYVNGSILWRDISKIEQTRQGWLLHHAGGRNYLSGKCLSDEANSFVAAKTRAC